jgi:hypothetical protein
MVGGAGGRGQKGRLQEARGGREETEHLAGHRAEK